MTTDTTHRHRAVASEDRYDKYGYLSVVDVCACGAAREPEGKWKGPVEPVWCVIRIDDANSTRQLPTTQDAWIVSGGVGERIDTTAVSEEAANSRAGQLNAAAGHRVAVVRAVERATLER